MPLWAKLVTHKVLKWSDEYALSEEWQTQVQDVTVSDVATSITKDSTYGQPRHMVLLDIDYEAQLIPSSTPGHYHLYLDVPGGIEHEKYMRLLRALSDAKVIEPGFAQSAISRGFSSLRLPWKSK